MTGLALLLVLLGSAVSIGGAVMFVGTLIGIRRGHRGANLEYGIAPAMIIAFGLWLFDMGAGWPGWHGAAYVLAAIGLAIPFTVAILWR